MDFQVGILALFKDIRGGSVNFLCLSECVN